MRDKSALAQSGLERAADLEHEIERLNRHVASVEQVKKVLQKEASSTNLEITQLQLQIQERDQVCVCGGHGRRSVAGKWGGGSLPAN